MKRRMFLGAAATAWVTTGLPRRAQAAETIKVGTLFPKASPWGKVFETWVRAVKEKSGGKLELQFIYNGAQGDEDAMVAKIKSGQLQGAYVGGVGLGKVYKPILALQMPLFTSWAKLDKARDSMKGELQKGAKDAGFMIAGWGDVGLVRMFSRGFAIKLPDDLRGKQAYHHPLDPIVEQIYKVIGGVNAVEVPTSDVVEGLTTGKIDAFMAPSLLAEQLRFASKVNHVTDHVVGTAIGALVFSQPWIDGLPADLRAILTDTGKVAATALTKRVRSDDNAAFSRVKKRMTVTTLSADDISKWETIFKQTREQLKPAPGTFRSDLVTALEGFAR